MVSVSSFKPPFLIIFYHFPSCRLQYSPFYLFPCFPLQYHHSTIFSPTFYPPLRTLTFSTFSNSTFSSISLHFPLFLFFLIFLSFPHFPLIWCSPFPPVLLFFPFSFHFYLSHHVPFISSIPPQFPLYSPYLPTHPRSSPARRASTVWLRALWILHSLLEIISTAEVKAGGPCLSSTLFWTPLLRASSSPSVTLFFRFGGKRDFRGLELAFSNGLLGIKKLKK